jgi:hypothetical protein
MGEPALRLVTRRTAKGGVKDLFVREIVEYVFESQLIVQGR